MQQEVALVGGVHRCGDRTDPCRTQPEVDPFRAGRGEQRDAITRSDTQVQQRISRRAGPPPHLLERHVGTGDRHHHPVRKLLGATIEHRRDAEPIDTEISRADRLSVACGCRPSRHAGHSGSSKPSLPPGRDHRWRCSRSLRASSLRPGRSGAPSAAAPRSRAPLRVRDSASPGTSCSPR